MRLELIIPHRSEPYADGYVLPMFSLALVILVCGIKPFVEYREGDAISVAKIRFGVMLSQCLLLGLLIGGFNGRSPSAILEVLVRALPRVSSAE